LHSFAQAFLRLTHRWYVGWFPLSLVVREKVAKLPIPSEAPSAQPTPAQAQPPKQAIPEKDPWILAIDLSPLTKEILLQQRNQPTREPHDQSSSAQAAAAQPQVPATASESTANTGKKISTK